MRLGRDTEGHGRMKPIRAPDENTISLQWAGLPLEYWVDLSILEWSPVSEILLELSGKFPEHSRECHISIISARLIHLAQLNEIGFQFETGEVRTDLSTDEGLTKLKFSQTWELSGEEELIAFFKTLSFRQKLSNLWNRIKGKRYTGRGSSLRRSWLTRLPEK